jgi:hypothetical protein
MPVRMISLMTSSTGRLKRVDAYTIAVATSVSFW